METEEPSEISPLLVNGQAAPVEGTNPSEPKPLHQQLRKVVRSRGFLATFFSLGFLIILWCIIYMGIIPPMVHDAVNGHGSEIKHMHLHDVNPIVVNISVLIPFSDPKPVSANAEFGILKLSALDPESTYAPETLLGYFTLEPLCVPALEPEVWINSSLTFYEPNYSWISWFLKLGSSHGFNKQDFALSGYPKIGIPVTLASWTTELYRIYKFDPKANLDFDISKFNATADNIKFVPKNDGDKTYYVVSLTGHFINPFPVTISFMKVQIDFQVYYKGVPILRIMTNSGKIGLGAGKNSQDIKAISNSLYTQELMELIENVSEGKDTPIMVRDIKFLGNPKFESIQDMADGFSIPVTVPAMKESDLVKLKTKISSLSDE